MVAIGRLRGTVGPALREVWQDLHDRDPASTLTQGPSWMAALTEQTRWRDATRYYVTGDDRRFVLPLAVRGPERGGAVYASMPAGWGMGGIIGSHPPRPEDADLIMEDLRALRAMSIRLLPNPLDGDVWHAAAAEGRGMALRRYSHVVDLEGGFEKVRNDRFRRTARKVSNRAMTAGLDVERDDTGRLIPVYRDLFKRSVDRWAARNHEPRWLAHARAGRQDPPGKLENLADALRGDLVTWVAWYRGEAAAAGITLRGNSHFSWRAAMHEVLGPATHAAYLIQYLTIEEACKEGATHFYLGESGSFAGRALFKERFGARGYHYPEIRMERIPATRATEMLAGAVKRLVGYQKH